MLRKKINNFLKPARGKRKKYNWQRKKWLPYTVSVLLAIIVVSSALFFIYKKPATIVYQDSLTAKDNFLVAQDQLLNQDFESAEKSLASAIVNFSSAKKEFNKFKWLKIFPWIGTQVSAVDNLLEAGISTGRSIMTINEIAISIISPLEKNDDISLNSLSEEEITQLLENIFNSKSSLEEAKTSIDSAVISVNEIPDRGLIRKIKEAATPLKERVPQLQAAIDQAISASQIIPFMAGYPERKTYLFLLQNNTELRPTGGFIGTYGILKVVNGDIDSFITDNVYNLDEPAEEWLFEEPPWPLTRYNKVFQWFFRDSNWSPDFPTAAQKAEWFYHQERGPEKNIDGVIAVTPTFIQSLLNLTGEISVNGLNFTDENLVDTLQFQVDEGFLRQGLEESARKEIIGVLSKKLLDGVLDLPKSKWPDLWNVFTKDIREKHILMYIKDNYVQEFILKENWGGAIKQVPHDYFTVIDANLASLKSDPGVKRSISYMVRRDSGNLIADLSIHYKNEGTITWKTTRYRTYVRVYVPQGAKLLKSEGAMVDCKLSDKGSIEQTEELDKLVFGTFLCIEPDEEKVLRLKYKLPDAIFDKFKNDDTYQLLVQKQPGTANYSLNIDINLNKNPKVVEGIDKYEKKSNNEISISTDLSTDREIEIYY